MHSMRTGAPCEPNYRKSSAAWRGIIRQKAPGRAGKATATGRPAGQLNATPVPSGLGRPSCRYCTQFLSLHCTNLCKYGCYPLGRHESGAAPHPSSCSASDGTSHHSARRRDGRAAGGPRALVARWRGRLRRVSIPYALLNATQRKGRYGVSGSMWTILLVCWPSVHMLESTPGFVPFCTSIWRVLMEVGRR